MSISDQEFKEKLKESLPEVLSELGYVHSIEELATKKDIQEILKRLDKQNQKFEEQNQKFEEQNQKFEEQNQKFDQMLLEIKELRAGFGTLGDRTGHEFESIILSLCEELLEEEGVAVENIEKFGIRNSDPDILSGIRKITFDGYLRNEDDILLEIKFRMDSSKLNWFISRADAFQQLTGKNPELWVVAIEIDEIAMDIAEERGIRVITRK